MGKGKVFKVRTIREYDTAVNHSTGRVVVLLGTRTTLLHCCHFEDTYKGLADRFPDVTFCKVVWEECNYELIKERFKGETVRGIETFPRGARAALNSLRGARADRSDARPRPRYCRFFLDGRQQDWWEGEDESAYVTKIDNLRKRLADVKARATAAAAERARGGASAAAEAAPARILPPKKDEKKAKEPKFAVVMEFKGGEGRECTLKIGVPKKWRSGPVKKLLAAFVERFNNTRVGVKPLEAVTAAKRTSEGPVDVDGDAVVEDALRGASRDGDGAVFLDVSEVETTGPTAGDVALQEILSTTGAHAPRAGRGGVVAGGFILDKIRRNNPEAARAADELLALNEELRTLRSEARATGAELAPEAEKVGPGALRDATPPTAEMQRVLQEVVKLLQSKDGDPVENAQSAAEILEHEGARYGGVTNVELHALAASCDERRGRDADARVNLERARDLLGSVDAPRYPQQARAWQAVSQRLLAVETRAVQQRGDLSRAADAVQISKALTLCEKWEPTRWLSHAEVAKAVDDPGEAEAAYRSAIDRDGGMRRAYFGLAQVLEQGQGKGYKKRVKEVAKRAVKNFVWLRVNQRPSQFSDRLAAAQLWRKPNALTDEGRDEDDAGDVDDVANPPTQALLDVVDAAARALEAQWAGVKADFERSARNADGHHAAYCQPITDARWTHKKEKEQLRSIAPLRTQAQRIDPMCARFPKAAAAVDSWRDARHAADCGVAEAYLTVLKPGAREPAHCGPSNCVLTAQLAVVCPPDGAAITRVGDETAALAEGSVLVLDDSFEHERRNNAPKGGKDLVLLIVQFWHPGVPPEFRSPDGLKFFAP